MAKSQLSLKTKTTVAFYPQLRLSDMDLYLNKHSIIEINYNISNTDSVFLKLKKTCK